MIRNANKNDVNKIAEMHKLLHSINCEIRSDFFRMPDDSFFISETKKMIDDEKTSVVVICENEEILGCAIFRLAEPNSEVDTNVKKIIIQQIFISQNNRNNGYGKMLVDYITEQGKALGCCSVECGVWFENYDAVDFYSICGFKPVTYKMEKTI